MNLEVFALERVFHKKVFVDGNKSTAIYWRDCVLAPDAKPGTQGYMVVYEDGSCLHTYHNPENWN